MARRTPNTMEPLTQRIYEAIPDEWIEAEELMAVLVPQVPPGLALRHYDEAREKYEARKRSDGSGWTPKKRGLKEHERIASGARNIINARLINLTNHHWIDAEVRGDRRDRWFRKSYERAWAEHCCAHGGSCRGSRDDSPQPAADAPAMASREVTQLIVTEALRPHFEQFGWRLKSAVEDVVDGICPPERAATNGAA